MAIICCYAIVPDAEQAQRSWQSLPELAIELDAVKFTYYSVLTTVLRLGSTLLHDTRMREECLHNARKAIFSMQSLQAQVLTSNELSLDVLFW